MSVAIVTQLVTQPGAASLVIRQHVDRLPGRARIAAAQAGADRGRVAGEVVADDVQAELAQDRGGGLAFEEEVERGPDELAGGDVTAPEAGRKSGRHAHLVAGARGCLDAEGVTGLLRDDDLRHAVTLAPWQEATGRQRRRRIRRRHSHASSVAPSCKPRVAPAGASCWRAPPRTHSSAASKRTVSAGRRRRCRWTSLLGRSSVHDAVGAEPQPKVATMRAAGTRVYLRASGLLRTNENWTTGHSRKDQGMTKAAADQVRRQ